MTQLDALRIFGSLTYGTRLDHTHTLVPAIDYRLAPDSPFPAAIQDAIAAYLYLMNPPADSGRTPIDPKNIVIMGDSAGGGKNPHSELEDLEI